MKSMKIHPQLPHTAPNVVLMMISMGMLLFLTHCGSPNPSPTSSSSSTTAPQETAEPTVTGESLPGLVVYGTVKDGSGAGVENVKIYRSYSAYPGEVIAITDASGQFASPFYPIPGDEMVSVWAEKTGLVFEPLNYQWRHYYGYERNKCDFLAHQP